MIHDEFMKERKPKNAKAREKYVERIKAKLNELQLMYDRRLTKHNQKIEEIDDLQKVLISLKKEIDDLQKYYEELLVIDYDLPAQEEPEVVEEPEEPDEPEKTEEDQLKEALQKKGITIKDLLTELEKKNE